MRRTFACAALATIMTAAAASAQDAAGRYQLERTEDGYVRLDTQTGRMTLCREGASRLVCTLAAEERQAHDRDLEALHGRIEALESRIAALESARPAAGLPDEEEFERGLSYMERFLRRFMGIVSQMDRQFGQEEPGRTPDRT